MKKILLPIKPVYVAKILSGEKKVEYRKKVVADVDFILIYASAPIKKIVAEFQVENIISSSPEKLWAETKGVGGIEESDYFHYFQGCEKAYAYTISQLTIYENPLDLSDLGIERAPQSYQYINCIYKK